MTWASVAQFVHLHEEDLGPELDVLPFPEEDEDHAGAVVHAQQPSAAKPLPQASDAVVAAASEPEGEKAVGVREGSGTFATNGAWRSTHARTHTKHTTLSTLHTHTKHAHSKHTAHSAH